MLDRVAEIQPDVIDFIFEQGRTAADRQLRDLDSLDAKATQIFSAATVIVGLAGFSGRANATLTIAVIVYVIAAYSALYALWLVKVSVHRLARTASEALLVSVVPRHKVRDGHGHGRRIRRQRTVPWTQATRSARCACPHGDRDGSRRSRRHFHSLVVASPLSDVHRLPRFDRRRRRRCRSLRGLVGLRRRHAPIVSEAHDARRAVLVRAGADVPEASCRNPALQRRLHR